MLGNLVQKFDLPINSDLLLVVLAVHSVEPCRDDRAAEASQEDHANQGNEEQTRAFNLLN